MDHWKTIHHSSLFQFRFIDYLKGLEFDFIALSILIKVLYLILKKRKFYIIEETHVLIRALWIIKVEIISELLVCEITFAEIMKRSDWVGMQITFIGLEPGYICTELKQLISSDAKFLLRSQQNIKKPTS